VISGWTSLAQDASSTLHINIGTTWILGKSVSSSLCLAISEMEWYDLLNYAVLVEKINVL
jgi:hypothetical protein